MKTTKMMKSLLTGIFAVVFTAVAFAQRPDANFVSKNPITDNLLTGDNTVLLIIELATRFNKCGS